jgi:pimeloyl-ACP methyl ester carboxylesterase
MALYSSVGGHMNVEHGVWMPNDFDACTVDNLTLQSDIQGIDHLLDLSRRLSPPATFPLVGHSLGGLVALQGAYDYPLALHHPSVIDEVIDTVRTIDAPLTGSCGRDPDGGPVIRRRERT